MTTARSPSNLAREAPNLVRFERTINKGTVQDLLKSAVLKFGDAKREANAGTTRVEAAYDTILICALAVFAAHGYRVTSGPGHHNVALEGLAAELHLATAFVDEIDLLQEIRKRKYTGLVSVRPADLTTALAMATRILNETEAWLSERHPDMLKP